MTESDPDSEIGPIEMSQVQRSPPTWRAIIEKHSMVGSPPRRFRTIQVLPRDFPAFLRQAERAVIGPAAARRRVEGASCRT
jgi:hypothetical protein